MLDAILTGLVYTPHSAVALRAVIRFPAPP